jgi:hypothetical protein
MSAKAKILVAALACAAAQLVVDAPLTAAAPTSATRTDQVGKTFLFDYGDLVIRVRYLSDTRLEWEQVNGPTIGLKAVEEYGASTVRPGVYFVWWQEKDTSIVTQVVDLGERRVHTTWTSADKKLASFQGTIVPQPSAAGTRR